MSALTLVVRMARVWLGLCLTTAGRFVRRKAGGAWHGLRHATRRPRQAEVPVEVVVSNWRDRWAVERALVAGVRQLRRVADVPSSDTVAVVAHGAVKLGPDGHYLAGRTEVGQRPDGSRFALIRLALEAGDWRLGHDDLLNALTEQWLALVAQLEGGTRVLIPLELDLLGARDAATDPDETTAESPETDSDDGVDDHELHLVRPSTYIGPAIVTRATSLAPGRNATPPTNGHDTPPTDR